MPSIGNRTVNLHTVDRDETVYAGATHTVSHVDTVALRRTLPPNSSKPLRTNMRFERGFAPVAGSTDLTEKPVTVSVAITAPSGVDLAAVTAYVADTLTQASASAGSLAVTGDIHLS